MQTVILHIKLYAIFLLFYFLLPFFPNLATTRRVRLKEFKHHFWLYIYIMLNLTANSNVVGNIVQGLRINKKISSDQSVLRNKSQEKFKLVWICGTSHMDQSLVPVTRFWSKNGKSTQWDLSRQLVKTQKTTHQKRWVPKATHQLSALFIYKL